MEKETGRRNIIEDIKDVKDTKEIKIETSNRIVCFPYCWLRDNCRCSDCYDLKTNKRSKNIVELPEDLSVKSCMKRDNIIEIIWHDEHWTMYDADFLEASHYEAWVEGKKIERILWKGERVPNNSSIPAGSCPVFHLNPTQFSDTNCAGSEIPAGSASSKLQSLDCDSNVPAESSSVLQMEWEDRFERRVSGFRRNIRAEYRKVQFLDQTDIAFVDRDDFLGNEETFEKFLKSLVTYGVAFVDNVKPSIEDTELVIRRVAPPQNTMFGGMWKFTSDLNRADTAYTNIPLAPHNDGTYMTVSPGLQVLHCLEHNGTGGDTIAVDGFFAAHTLQGAKPDLYNILCDKMQPAKYEEKGWHLYHCDRVIKKDPLTGQLEQIRYNVYDRTQHCVSTEPSTVVRMNEALKEFGRICDLDSVKWQIKLNPGRVFFFDNWRILHGRTGFTGRRVLGGAYVSRDDWMSAARIRGFIQ